jgi:hypothetical protein
VQRGHGNRVVASPAPPVLSLMAALPEWFGGASWANWRVVLKALFTLPTGNDDLALFQRLSGRTTPPAERVKEAWLVFGRRAGKSCQLVSATGLSDLVRRPVGLFRRIMETSLVCP